MATLLWAPSLGAVDAALLAGGLAAAAVLDALRTGDRRIAYGLVPTVPVLAWATTLAVGFSEPIAGVALCLTGMVAVGVSVLVPHEWSGPPALAGVVASAGGLALASVEPAAFGAALVLTGLLVVGVAVIRSSAPESLPRVVRGGLPAWPLGVVGASVATVGVWVLLAESAVTASDAYAAPVAVLLIGAGATLRLDQPSTARPSSWVAYGPAIVLLTATALVERANGGGGDHAIVAGAVGVGAVALGGARRLGGPLVLGTAAVVAVAGYESLIVTRGVPTWAWLALGGALLLGAGTVMERHEVGPLETGRRLVDVIQDRYS
jgi:hypothetical protein